MKTRLLMAALLPLLMAAGQVQARERIQLGNNPALSPDGSLLAFDWNGDVWVVPTKGGTARQLTTNPARDAEPRFSPDGKEIAFVSTREGPAQVFVVPVEGGSPHQLTFHSSESSLLEWLPDGKTLLVSGRRDHHWRHAERFFRVGRDERLAEVPLFDDYGSSGTVSHDGKRILFTRETEPWWRKGYHGSQASQVWMMDLDTHTPKQLIAHDRGARWPMWRPDGKGFFYVGAEGGSYNLREYDFASSKSRAVTKFDDGDDSVVFPCISRDGSTIVFRRLFDFYLLRLGSKDAPVKMAIFLDNDRVIERKERRVLSSASQAAFTNDGLEIAFIAGGDLWVMDTELREPVQVTSTPEEERDPVWSSDGEAIFFGSDKDGQGDLYKAERPDPKKPWFLTKGFKIDRLTNDDALETGLRLTPDGKLAFIKGRGDLWTMGRDGKDPKQLLKGWSRPDFDFSPDGKWVTYAVDDNDFNRDVWLMPVDGSKPAFNVSRSPNPDGSPRFSPDGKLLAFTGRRGEKEFDIHYVYLRADDEERTTRERTLDKALDKINKARPKPPGEKPEDKPTPKPTEFVIDFDGIFERIHRVSIPNSTEDDLLWSPDSKKLAFRGTVNNQAGLYTIEFPENLTPTSLTTSAGSQLRWLKNGQVVGLSNGLPAVVSGGAGSGGAPTGGATGGGGRPPFGRPGGGATTTPSTDTTTPAASGYRFSARQETDLPKKYAAAFDSAWRTMRDNWYDEKMGNRDWTQIRAKYRDMASKCVDNEMLGTVVNLMLGELNGSHLGFSASPRRGGPPPTTPPTTPTPPGTPEPDSGWSDQTAHLGVRFVADHMGPGWKVRDVLPGGPADQKKSKIVAGDVILSIDGKEVTPKTDVTEVLNGPTGRDVVLKVQNAEGKDREVTLRPISYTLARSLLRDKWLADNRKMVEAMSDGKLGYIHVSAMDMASFYRFQEELYAVGYGKDGLIIDVRENGGGSTTDHLLTALTQPIHSVAIPRGAEGSGYPSDRKVYTTWNKPIVVMCNQNSFSNAEMFSHAIKTLKRGQLVGVQSAGGVISTGAAAVMDVGMVRLPFRGWYLIGDGQDMELNGALPDHVVWPGLEEMPRGKDVQIEKAVSVLKEDVKAFQAKPQPKPIKATERPPLPPLDR